MLFDSTPAIGRTPLGDRDNSLRYALAPFYAGVYTRPMKFLPIASIILCALLGACGPKEIGEGQSMEYAGPLDVTAADQMRLPMTGANNTERALYYYNRPEISERVRDAQLYRFNRALGIAPPPESPAYREVPKQKSPFRQ